MELRAFKIPPLALLLTVSILAIGELACGTSLYFVAMMMITMLCIGVTYNLLGGLSTLSGICFADLSLQTIVISQFAKFFFREAADKSLESPNLTITVYAVFYFSAMLGMFAYSRTRIRVPKPLEPETPAQRQALYVLALALGTVGIAAYEYYNGPSAQTTQYGIGHSLSIAGLPLLLLAIVIAVDSRIIQTDGRHSLGPRAVFPGVAVILGGFVDTQRLTMMTPILVYFVVCYVRGYRFRRIHYVAAVLVVGLFFYFISPLELYTRDLIAGEGLSERIHTTFFTLEEGLTPEELLAAQESNLEEKGARREQYFDVPGTFVLSRLSLIRADSNVISACSTGYHYGFAAIKIDLLKNIPSFLYPNKPRDVSGQDYIGHVSGMSPDNEYNTYPQISGVGDSFGAFGWFGVVLYPLVALPFMFMFFESAFDIRRPWGTVALGMCVPQWSAIMLTAYLPLLVRTSINLILLSYILGWATRFIPSKRDRKSSKQRVTGVLAGAGISWRNRDSGVNHAGYGNAS
jgi:hypothetical protein